MLASLAYFTLPHLESDIPGHTEPIPLELKTLSHLPDSCMSLLMGVLSPTPVAKQTDRLPSPFLAICTDCQRNC